MTLFASYARFSERLIRRNSFEDHFITNLIRLIRRNTLLYLTLFSSFARFSERLIRRNSFEDHFITTLVKGYIFYICEVALVIDEV